MVSESEEALYKVTILGVEPGMRGELSATLARIVRNYTGEQIVERLERLPWVLTRKAKTDIAARLVKMLERRGASVKVEPPLSAPETPVRLTRPIPPGRDSHAPAQGEALTEVARFSAQASPGPAEPHCRLRSGPGGKHAGASGTLLRVGVGPRTALTWGDTGPLVPNLQDSHEGAVWNRRNFMGRTFDVVPLGRIGFGSIRCVRGFTAKRARGKYCDHTLDASLLWRCDLRCVSDIPGTISGCKGVFKVRLQEIQTPFMGLRTCFSRSRGDNDYRYCDGSVGVPTHHERSGSTASVGCRRSGHPVGASACGGAVSFYPDIAIRTRHCARKQTCSGVAGPEPRTASRHSQ